jgi:hypothetical protein
MVRGGANDGLIRIATQVMDQFNAAKHGRVTSRRTALYLIAPAILADQAEKATAYRSC